MTADEFILQIVSDHKAEIVRGDLQKVYNDFIKALHAMEPNAMPINKFHYITNCSDLTAFLIDCGVTVNTILAKFKGEIPSLFLNTVCIDSNKLKPREIVVPGTVSRISSYAFLGSCIRSIIIEEGVKEIGAIFLDPGMGPQKLKYLSIPDSVVDLPKNIITSCKGTLIECNGLQANILIKGKRTWYKGENLQKDEIEALLQKYNVVVNAVR